MEKVDLNTVFFKYRIEDVFTLPRSRLAVYSKIESGEISNDSTVLVTDINGNVLKKVAIYDIDFFDRSRNGKNITVTWMGYIGIIFDGVDIDTLSVGNYIVIE